MEDNKITTYPNQSTIIIHKPQYKGDFVQVSIEEWQEAFQKLPRISFGLYLYLCGNKDGFKYALSSKDVQQTLKVSDSSYRRAIEDLLGAGYLMMRNGKKNTMDFYTSPQPTDYVKKVYKRKVKDGGAAAAASVSIQHDPYDEPDPFKPDYSSYHSSLYNRYTWEP